MRKRYESMVTAMEQANLEPVVIEDLVKFGEDRGYERGRTETWVRRFARRLGRALTNSERATVAQRLAALGDERLADVVLSPSGPEALVTWLGDPTAY